MGSIDVRVSYEPAVVIFRSKMTRWHLKHVTASGRQLYSLLYTLWNDSQGLKATGNSIDSPFQLQLSLGVFGDASRRIKSKFEKRETYIFEDRIGKLALADHPIIDVVPRKSLIDRFSNSAVKLDPSPHMLDTVC